MSYMKHSYSDRPGGVYAGKCKHCGLSEGQHNVSDEERLEQTMQESRNLLAAAQGQYLGKTYGEMMAEVLAPSNVKAEFLEQVLTPEAYRARCNFCGILQPQTTADLTAAAVALIEDGTMPTYADDESERQGRSEYRCSFCHEEVANVISHQPDCKWMALVRAVEAYKQ